MEVKQIQQFLFIFIREQIKWGFITKTFTRLTVYMVEDKGDILSLQVLLS